jgi:hypothetical protein
MEKKKAEKKKAPEKKSKAKAAEELAGEEAPRIKPEPKKKGGARKGAGRPAAWEPDAGQTFTMSDVMGEGLKARDYGDKSDKAIQQAEEHDRRAMIMIQKLAPGQLDFLVKAIVATPFNGAAAITKWGGWKLKPDQESWLSMVWEPTIRFYLPYWLARWGHFALPILLSMPIVTHKAKGYAEHISKLRKQRAGAVDSKRESKGRQNDPSPQDIPAV